ncbi:hypothetical protein [Staphylococcus nepalensis]|uniref:hypothetical protein n=1 Tax=Staphylococcus nepalensis TaxID=214473 RepID=UPI000BC2CAE6|nr:hypothetical protein [Staphylococcus nepalensis]ATH60211.1 hypothetical protein BJD96_07790 [Staphylococcus nepalensis]
MGISSLIISILAGILSLATFLHELYTSRFSSTAKVLSIHEVPHNGFYMKVLITNHSSNPVSITSVHVDGIINVSEKQIVLEGTKTKLPFYTNSLPIEIGSYGAVNLTLFFRNAKRLYDYEDLVPIKINTSRKEINDVINIKTFKKNLSELRE